MNNKLSKIAKILKTTIPSINCKIKKVRGCPWYEITTPLEDVFVFGFDEHGIVFKKQKYYQESEYHELWKKTIHNEIIKAEKEVDINLLSSHNV